MVTLYEILKRRVQFLKTFHASWYDIGIATKTSGRTVRAWRSGEHFPRHPDDLDAACQRILDTAATDPKMAKRLKKCGALLDTK